MSSLYLGVPQHLSVKTPLFTYRVATLLDTMYAKCQHCEGLFSNEKQRDFHVEEKCTEVETNE